MSMRMKNRVTFFQYQLLCYILFYLKDENLQKFLKEATMMDPRFKGRLGGEAATDIWDRLEKAAVANATAAVAQVFSLCVYNLVLLHHDVVSMLKECSFTICVSIASHWGPQSTQRGGWCWHGQARKICNFRFFLTQPLHSKSDLYLFCKPHTSFFVVFQLSKVQKSPLEKLFEDEDRELQQAASQAGRVPSITEQVHKELQIYKRLPGITSGQDPVAWWWSKRDTLPNLSALSEKYLCVPASSTPSERVFSCAGHAISQERCRIAPEKANMIIFLQKNC